ncbi:MULTISPECIES: hypothetical protein [Streptomyces]|nr:hypothetical protein [Streptomyces sp. XC 2026]
MPRWVLQEQVWTKLLDHAGFTRINVDVLRGSPETLLVSAHRAPG